MNIPKHHILVVESDNYAKEMVCWYLTRAGYQLTVTTSYAESLTLAAARQFKLYLLGEGFEDRTNLDLCQQIRMFDSDTPILFCSAWAFPDDIDRGMKAGAQAYLTKPCSLDEMAQTIKQLINKTATKVEVKSSRLPERVGPNPHLGSIGVECLLSI
jgi:DNA-binding response OmpR family regulator